MKHALILLFCLGISQSISAQGIHQTPSRFNSKNSIQFELMGAGYVYSINYERVVLNGSRLKTNAQVGYSYFPYLRTLIPLSINELISFGKHHAEIGAGYTYSPNGESFYMGRLGYRFQKPDGKWLFRIDYMPWSNEVASSEQSGVVYKPEWYSWAGVSFGYSF